MRKRYETGRGVAPDFVEAVQWYRRAAEQGDVTAQRTLGAMYETGRGVAQDLAEAVRWYRRAAEQVGVLPLTTLDAMYEDGRGVAQDFGETVHWVRRAAGVEHAGQEYAALASALITFRRDPAFLADPRGLQPVKQDEDEGKSATILRAKGAEMTTVVCWNMNHIQESWRTLTKMGADVALLQEPCKVPPDLADRVDIEPPGPLGGLGLVPAGVRRESAREATPPPAADRQVVRSREGRLVQASSLARADIRGPDRSQRRPYRRRRPSLPA